MQLLQRSNGTNNTMSTMEADFANNGTSKTSADSDLAEDVADPALVAGVSASAVLFVILAAIIVGLAMYQRYRVARQRAAIMATPVHRGEDSVLAVATQDENGTHTLPDPFEKEKHGKKRRRRLFRLRKGVLV